MRCGTHMLWPQLMAQNRHATSTVFARFKSKSTRSAHLKSTRPASKPSGPNNSTPRRKGSPRVDSTKEALDILKTLRMPMDSVADAPAQTEPHLKSALRAAPPSSALGNATSPRDFMKRAHQARGGPEDGVTLQIDEKEEAVQQRIMVMRRKLLWPGIWTLLALAGTYGTLAYLDVKAGVPSSDGSQLPERAQLPQNWYLTPTIIREGIQAGWNELDYLTIGIVAASLAIHLLRKSPLPIWENLIHVTGEAKWTAFTYPLVNSSWTHAVQNMAALAWFLPGVVRYLDGDLFHTSAFLVGVPLITSYFTHFAYRFNWTSGLVLNLGASGAVAAAFGVYSVAYAHEKVWVPQGLVLRLDAMYWGLLFAASQAYSMVRSPKNGNRPAYLIHIASLGLGVAYAYFDLKHHLWIPLVSEISSTQESGSNLEG